MVRIAKPSSIAETRRAIDNFIADESEEDLVIAPPRDARHEILWLIASQYHRSIKGPCHLTSGTYSHDGKCYAMLVKCLGRGDPELAKRFRPTTYHRYRGVVHSANG